MNLKIVLSVLTYVVSVCVFAQNKNDFSILEERINKKAVSIIEFNSNAERIDQNNKLYDLLLETLKKHGSFDYPFDSLETISVLKSPDDRFRIYTWYFPLIDGDFKHFGFLQSRSLEQDTIVIYEFVDRSQKIEDPEFMSLDHTNWFGAYYYELIHNSHNGNDYYTLLGWRGNNPLIRQRVIETLMIKSDGEPIFGKEMFEYKEKKHKRILFNYSARVSMALKYDLQVLESEGRRRGRPVKLIVFDRLVPADESLKGHYQFYKPETNIFDGFIFENGKWKFLSDIDVRADSRDIPEPVRLQDHLENEK